MQQVITYIRFWFALGFLLLLTASGRDAQAQSTDGTELFAGDFVKAANPEFPVVSNQWNLLRLSLSNPYDRAVDLQVAIYFDIDPKLQYGRRIQIPPSTRVRAWLPILVPDPKHVVDRAFTYHVLVRSLGDSTGLLPDRFGSMQLDRTLQFESKEQSTGILHTPPEQVILDTESVDSPEVGALDFLLTGRFKRGVRRNWINLSPEFASRGEMGLQSLDQILIANNELLDSPKAHTSLRRWLFGGGHLWVMLDRVDSKILEQILQDRYQGQELERVELTSITLIDSMNRPQSTQEYDSPIKMTRLMIDDVDVLFSVDGWPAAFSIDYGQGKLLVTTLAGNGWGRPRPSTDTQRSFATQWEKKVVALPAVEDIFSEFMSVDEGQADLKSVLTEEVKGAIGVEVPERSRIVGVLMGYALLSVGLAIWLGKTGRLPWFGAIGPVLALLSAGTLVGMRPEGWDVPPTAVVSQLVTPVTGSEDVLSKGVVGIYAPDASPLSLSGDGNDWMMPDTDGFHRGIRILSHDDDFGWNWENLTSQPGLHTTEFESAAVMKRVQADASLNEQGVTGSLLLPEGFVPEDAIIDSLRGRIGVQFTDGGQWIAFEKNTLSENQFLNANLLTDQQRRRMNILQPLLNKPTRPWDSGRPHLLFWTRPWKFGIKIDDRYQSEGEALVAVPLKIQRPPDNSRLTIPGPLLAFQEVTGPDGSRPGGLYNRKKQEWLPKKYSTSTWLGFDVPNVLLPLSLDQISVRIAVTGPVGQLELWAWDGSKRVSLRRWDNPVGQLSASFNDSSSMTLADDGRLLLYLTAGEGSFDQDAVQEEPKSDWKIESFDLSLQATTVSSQP